MRFILNGPIFYALQIQPKEIRGKIGEDMNNQFNESEYLTVNPDVAVAVRNTGFDGKIVVA